MKIKYEGLEPTQRGAASGYTIKGLKVRPDGTYGDQCNKFIFDNSQPAKDLSSVIPGTIVDVEMKQNGKFWNVVGVSVSTEEAPTYQNNTQNTSSDTPVKTYNSKPSFNPEAEKLKQVGISRSVALKESVNTVAMLWDRGAIKASAKQDFIVEATLVIASKYEDYLTNGYDDSTTKSDVSSKKAKELDQPGMPE